jgi:hydroxymethylpyrimidine pyrophosphatase-like HAD family hydrolase
MPNPRQNEQKEEYLQRCMADSESQNSFPDESQRYAVCESKWEESKMTALERYNRAFAEPKRISFDYDETLTQAKEIARNWIRKGAEVYIISARHDKSAMLKTAADLGIPASRVYATGSNKSKIEIIQKLKIDKHYDNNPDVIKQIGVRGELWINK